jgi:hypothetical protein
MRQTDEPSMPETISRSVLKPTILPPSNTSVLTESPSASSHRAATACLWGIVTFAPTNPAAAIPRTAASSSAARTGKAT